MEITTQPTPLSNATPQAVTTGAGAPGTAKAASRDDHVHDGLAAGAYGAVGNSAVGDAAANGAATTLSRSDHRHGREAFGAVVAMTYGGAGTNGVATTDARSDHVHPLAVLPGWVKVAAAQISAAANLDLAGLSGYKRYRLTIYGQASTAAQTLTFTGQVNGDTAAHYGDNRARVVSTTVSGQTNNLGTSWGLLDLAGGGAARKTQVSLELLLMLDTSAANNIQALWHAHGMESASAQTVEMSGGGYAENAVASITEVKVAFGNNFDGQYLLEGNND